MRERVPEQQYVGPVYMPPPLAGWAATLPVSALPNDLAPATAKYLGRLHQLSHDAAASLGYRLAAEVSAHLGSPVPPNVPIPAYLAAVLAERRTREENRSLPGATTPAAHRRGTEHQHTGRPRSRGQLTVGGGNRVTDQTSRRLVLKGAALGALASSLPGLVRRSHRQHPATNGIFGYGVASGDPPPTPSSSGPAPLPRTVRRPRSPLRAAGSGPRYRCGDRWPPTRSSVTSCSRAWSTPAPPATTPSRWTCAA